MQKQHQRVGKSKPFRRTYDYSLPPRQRFTNDEALRSMWPSVPAALQEHLVRRASEVNRGFAIYRDKMMGRSKGALGGHFELESALDDLHWLQHSKRSRAEEIARLKARVEALLAVCLPEMEDIAKRLALSEALAPFEDHAQAQGKSLSEWIRGHIEIEKALNEDIVGGIFLICERLQVDPLEVFTAALRPSIFSPVICH
jgi:hypothetical protein